MNLSKLTRWTVYQKVRREKRNICRALISQE